MNNKAVSILKCDTYDIESLIKNIRSHFDNLGGIDKFVKKGTRVLIKANLIMGKKADAAVTTNPNFIEALSKVIIEAGGIVTIADSPGGPFTPILLKSVYKASGMDKAAANSGAELNFDCTYKKIKAVNPVVSNDFNFISPFFSADLLISACKLKTHSKTAYTGAVKNLFGLIPGLEKPEFHSRYSELDKFCNMLIDICETAKPGLSFMDGIVAHEGNGPTGGSPKKVGLTLASENPYSLDLAASYIIGFEPNEVMTVKNSIERGLTQKSALDLNIIGENLREIRIPDFKKADTNIVSMFAFLPSWLRNRIEKFLTPYPIIDTPKCIGCGKCAESCAAHTIEIINKKAVINYNNCIKCFCCQEMCPIKAINIKRRSIFKF